jgi:hypothetical protein
MLGLYGFLFPAAENGSHDDHAGEDVAGVDDQDSQASGFEGVLGRPGGEDDAGPGDYGDEDSSLGRLVSGGLDEPGEEEGENEGSDQGNSVDEERAAAGLHELLHGAANAGEPGLPEGCEPEGSEDEVEERCEKDGDGVVTDGMHGAFLTAESEFRP